MSEGMGSSEVYDLFQAGKAHMERGDNAQAMVSLEKAKRRDPDKASIREALGVAYLRLRRYEEAAAEFEHILAAAPANDYAHYCLGRCLDRLGQRGLAAGHYKMAALLRPDVDYYQRAVEDLPD
jgi:tetratricopeptide (TPR) repeat protein